MASKNTAKKKKTKEEIKKDKRNYYYANREFVLASQKLTKLKRKKQLSLLPKEEEEKIKKLTKIVEAHYAAQNKVQRKGPGASSKKRADLSGMTDEQRSEHKRKAQAAWYKKNKKQHYDAHLKNKEAKLKAKKEEFIKAFREIYG